MGDVIDFLERKRRKEIRELVYGSYSYWVARSFLRHSNSATSKYDVAVEAQQDGRFYLYKYFFPDFDW
jgi:hypothetical protein